MSSHDIIRSIDIERTPRVVQIEGMFDVPQCEKSTEKWSVEIDLPEKWNIGLIVGPSGSGKSTIAREIWGEYIIEAMKWPENKAILDAFPKNMSTREICVLLGHIGFNSPPNWLRPYRVLSTGEKFRVMIARALAESTDQPIVIDEFTSVVDRQVAKVASHCVQKIVRKREAQMIAVSCHSDIIEWLQPDWIIQPQEGRLIRRRLRRRPRLTMEVFPCRRSVWRMFSKYHYMSSTLAGGMRCYCGIIENEMVVFVANRYFPHPKKKNIIKVSRIVVHPDYQGLGISGRISDHLGERYHREGYIYIYTTAHPAMIAYLSRSPRWEMMRRGFANPRRSSISTIKIQDKGFTKYQKYKSPLRQTMTFRYAPLKMTGNK